MMKPFMIVGIDVYHDSERKGQSVVGIVSSLNKNVSQLPYRLSLYKMDITSNVWNP